MFWGGPNISKYKDPWETNNFRGVHIFQLTCEIYVPGGGANISKYKDRGELFGGGGGGGGSKFCMTSVSWCCSCLVCSIPTCAPFACPGVLSRVTLFVLGLFLTHTRHAGYLVKCRTSVSTS